MYSELIQVLEKLFQENERLIAAGSKRNDPSTWRPDLPKPVDEYLKEIRREGS